MKLSKVIICQKSKKSKVIIRLKTKKSKVIIFLDLMKCLKNCLCHGFFTDTFPQTKKLALPVPASSLFSQNITKVPRFG